MAKLSVAVLGVVLVLGCLACSSEEQSAESGKRSTKPHEATPLASPLVVSLTLEPRRDENNGLFFVGTTNLPDGTRIGIDLKKGRKTRGQSAKIEVTKGSFRSSAFTDGGKPWASGSYVAVVNAYFNGAWQSKAILATLGGGGAPLLRGEFVRKDDPKLEDSDSVLEGTFKFKAPPVDVEIAGRANAIAAVKKARLKVDGRKSSESVEWAIENQFMPSKGIRPGSGWAATKESSGYRVVFSYFDGGKKAESIWTVNSSLRKVKYVNKFAKYMSFVPPD